MLTGSDHRWCVRCRPMDHYVPSPCRNVCVLEHDTCVGCNRTILEIVQPVGLSDGCCSEKSRLPAVHLVNDEAPDEIGEEPDDAEKRQARDQYDGQGYEAKAQAQCKVEDGWANRQDGDTRT